MKMNEFFKVGFDRILLFCVFYVPISANCDKNRYIYKKIYDSSFMETIIVLSALIYLYSERSDRLGLHTYKLIVFHVHRTYIAMSSNFLY